MAEGLDLHIGGQVAALGVQKTMYGSGGMAPTPAPVTAPRGRLVLIRPDGTEGGTHPLHDGETLIGRGQGTLDDPRDRVDGRADRQVD